jgi:hypothetical protein
VYSQEVDGEMLPPMGDYVAESSEELVQGGVPLPGEVPEESSEEELWEGEIIEDSEIELGGDPMPWPEEISDEIELGGEPLWPEDN